MEDMWMGDEEDDERLDNTLMMLEEQGLVPKTPCRMVENMMSTPKNPGDHKRMLTSTVFEDEGDDYKDHQENENDFCRYPLNYLSC